VKVSI